MCVANVLNAKHYGSKSHFRHYFNTLLFFQSEILLACLSLPEMNSLGGGGVGRIFPFPKMTGSHHGVLCPTHDTTNERRDNQTDTVNHNLGMNGPALPLKSSDVQSPRSCKITHTHTHI